MTGVTFREPVRALSLLELWVCFNHLHLETCQQLQLGDKCAMKKFLLYWKHISDFKSYKLPALTLKTSYVRQLPAL